MQLKTIPEDFVVVEVAQHMIKENGPYVLAEMTKRNLTTERAISTIADSLSLPRKCFGYAGTKDARALTRQYISIKVESSSVIERIKHFAKPPLVTLRFVGFLNEPLSLGHLEKNRFEIVVRNITSEKVHPITAIPNYFDEQRFSTANAQIGKLLVQKKFKDAADLIITTDTEVASRMQEHLAEKPNDAITAMRFIPRNILLMYVHAYQSLLFNEALREYILQNDPIAKLVDGAVPLVIPIKDVENVKIPLFGFGTEDHPIFGAIYERILKKEAVVPRDFVIRELPFLTVEGSERDAFFLIEQLTISQREDDDLHQGSAKQLVTFILPKGCYATMAIKCLYQVGSLRGNTGQ